jgi:DNA-binding SARP family transcriptional activator
MTFVSFGLLGVVEAHVGAEPVDLGHARQRWVLAALLADANRPVSIDRLTERVWADDPPYRARRLLASYLSRLRRVLAVAGGVDIRHGPGGYMISLPAKAVDVFRFRELVARARTERRLTLFDEALALWRDDAIAGLDTPWADTVRQTLGTERLLAQLDRADLVLARGDHNAVLAETSERAVAHPLDERIAGQLMLASYLAGQQAGALMEFERIRRRLADEFGADPGLVLRRLHERILTTDPELAPRRDTSVPHQLPASPRWFVGRDAELAVLDEVMTGGTGTVAVVAISGVGGVGKTSLALRWAHRNLARFPDGQLYVNLRGFDPTWSPLRPEVVVSQFLDALGVPPAALPADPEGRFALYRSRAVGRRLLVVLDNARDAGQVEPLLPGSETCAVIITSRNRPGSLGVRGTHLLDLTVFAELEARELLTRHLGTERVSAEPAVVDDFVRWSGGLPLAVSIVASRAGANPRFRLEVLARELADTSARLDALDAGDLTTNVRAVFSWSYRALDPEAARVFRLLGAAPESDLSLTAAAALLGLPLQRTRAALRQLVGAHLLQEHVPGRYRMHDLVWLYADELVTEHERQEVLRRLVDFYLHTAMAADRLLRPERRPIELPPLPGCPSPPLTDRASAVAWFAGEHRCLMAALDSAVRRGAHEDVWRLAWCVSGFHVLRGQLLEDLTAWRAGLAAAEAIGRPEPQAVASMYLGAAYMRVGSHEMAERHVWAALSFARQVGSPDLVADAERALGWVLGQGGALVNALLHTSEALKYYSATGNGLRQADALNSLGWYAAQLGLLAAGRAYCEQALVLCRRHDHCRGETVTLDSLGYIAQELGEYEVALSQYGSALALARETDDVYDEAGILANLGDTHSALGNADAARQAWEQARELYRTHQRTQDVDRLDGKLGAVAR